MPPLKTTAGQVLVNEALPPEYRDYSRTLGADELDELLGAIGKESPELYRDVSHALVQLGRESVFAEGTTIRLSDLMPDSDLRDEIFDHVTKKEKEIHGSKMSPAQKQEALDGVYTELHQLLQDETFQRALKTDNPLALQVLSRARGNPTQLAAMLSSPGKFADAKGNTIPIFVRRSYSEGLSPEEYYAATFGARQGVISTKFATRDAGDFGKQLNVSSADLIVTEDDCGTNNGIPVGIGDADSVGALLARETSGYSTGAAVDAKMLKALKNKGRKELLIRSPITCQAKGGVCKRCVGLRENGKLPELRDFVGGMASSALAERIAQGSLNVKHSGGQSAKGDVTYSGFDVINQIGQVPKNFRHRATLASEEGKVDSIEPAPAGGTNITIGGQVHFVEAEQHAQVKVGDLVEAGDQLSTGIINPAEVVQYKGIGEGRRYYAERLTQAFRDSKLAANRRNAELIARAVIDHVEVEEPTGVGQHLPGDITSYNTLAYSYRPREDSQSVVPKDAVGQYLEQPALHYTIGTKLTNRMAKELSDFGVSNVVAHSQPPGFTPRMIRLRAVPHHGTDWVAKLQGTYLQSNLLKDVHRGATSSIHGRHPMPAVAYGVELGQSKKEEVTF